MPLIPALMPATGNGRSDPHFFDASTGGSLTIRRMRSSRFRTSGKQ